MLDSGPATCSQSPVEAFARSPLHAQPQGGSALFLSVQEAGEPFAHPLSLEPGAARSHALGRLSGAERLLGLPAPSLGMVLSSRVAVSCRSVPGELCGSVTWSEAGRDRVLCADC